MSTRPSSSAVAPGAARNRGSVGNSPSGSSRLASKYCVTKSLVVGKVTGAAYCSIIDNKHLNCLKLEVELVMFDVHLKFVVMGPRLILKAHMLTLRAVMAPVLL